MAHFLRKLRRLELQPARSDHHQERKAASARLGFPAGYPPSTTSLRPGLEAAPLVLDGVLYLVGPQNNVYAIDAAAGKLVWQYVYDWSSKEPTPGNKGARGLAMGDGRIYMGTQDDHMVALDAKTGGEVWNVKTDDVYKCLCSITSPPLFVKGKVITGVAGGDGPFRAYIQAFDAATGKRLWHFDTVPAPGQPGSETWPGGDTWKVGGVPRGSPVPMIRTASGVLGHGQRFSRPNGGRTSRIESLHRVSARARRRHRKAQVVFPGDSARRL